MIHSNSFIFNFKRIWKALKAVVTTVMAISLFGLFCAVANYLYVPETGYWVPFFWYHYDRAEEIDNVFIGSSHVYSDVNPFLLDEINGMNNFNLSAGGLTLNASYYMLREASGRHDLKNVYLELYYVVSAGENGDIYSGSSIINNRGVTDYADFSWNKFIFMLSMSKQDQYLETFFPFIRYREHLFEWDYIVDNVQNKQSGSHGFRHEDESGVVEYQDKGFWYTTKQYQEEALAYETEVDLEADGLMSGATEAYLRKIIEYCQKKGIHLALFVSPIYETQILSAQDYDAYHEQIAEIAAEYDVPFYDFNLCRSEYLDIMHKELFWDPGHLNTAGADVFTPFLWKVLSGTEENNQIYFCDSYEEKIRLDEAELYGVYYSVNGEGQREYTIASNRTKEMEYRVIISPQDGEQRVVQDFATNKKFELPQEEHGVITVVARDVARRDQIQTLEMRY
ncbi:MAG: hypothetical protein NC254_07995 [bacterium]|nr:hypothetical protein [bacterium]